MRMTTASIVVRFAVTALALAFVAARPPHETRGDGQSAELVTQLSGIWGLPPVDRQVGLTGSIFALDRDEAGRLRLNLMFEPRGWSCSAKNEPVTWNDALARFEWPNRSKRRSNEDCWLASTPRGNALDVRMFCPYTCTKDEVNTITLQRMADRRLTPPAGVVDTFCSSPDPLRQAFCTPGPLQDRIAETDHLADQLTVLDDDLATTAGRPDTDDVLLDLLDACKAGGSVTCLDERLAARNDALRSRIRERQNMLAREQQASQAKVIAVPGGSLPAAWKGTRHHVTDDFLPSLSIESCAGDSCTVTIEGETNYTFGYSERRGFCSMSADMFFTSAADAFAYVDIPESDRNRFGAGEFANFCRIDLHLTGNAIDVALHGAGCYDGCTEVPTRPLAGVYKPAGTPSFTCGDVSSLGWIEQNVCLDADLAALDRQLAAAYASARKQVSQRDAAAIATAQRNWLKEREDCEAGKHYSCLKEKYHKRITELKR
jgi:hypothetical protein